jgi:hypothetical protein
MIPIPIGMKHTAILEGSAPILVRCEHCGLEYVYTAERAARGEATALHFMSGSAAQAVACQEASKALLAELTYACDPVPCPSCGCYQALMVHFLRKSHLDWVFQPTFRTCPVHYP